MEELLSQLKVSNEANLHNFTQLKISTFLGYGFLILILFCVVWLPFTKRTNTDVQRKTFLITFVDCSDSINDFADPN
jgi:hypothetical protein